MSIPNVFEEHGLTRRTRIRVQRRFMASDLVVVQVETFGAWVSWLGNHADVEHGNRWRDARVEDFAVSELPKVRDAATP